ncbi:hypothetical protein G5714_013571 [Onychostoma macrolepis]|uniref:Uncharacterized protein n=1 Tax=Onychostoma macrolepis TaxID=369639 RepID=A0A7J6CF12_9TELE|nr:hypothetical protein G5714_013571 [Onychostoma macrolepis]
MILDCVCTKNTDSLSTTWCLYTYLTPVHRLKTQRQQRAARESMLTGLDHKNCFLTIDVLCYERYFTVPSLNLDSLLSVKEKIRQEGWLDSHLKTNLDFSIQTLEAFPASKRRDVSLTLEETPGHLSCPSKDPSRISTDDLKPVLDHIKLKITCGELHLTYSTHQPLHTLHIQPRRRVFLGKTLSLEKILETKTHLEKSGEMRKDLLTCFQHLL